MLTGWWKSQPMLQIVQRCADGQTSAKHTKSIAIYFVATQTDAMHASLIEFGPALVLLKWQ